MQNKTLLKTAFLSEEHGVIAIKFSILLTLLLLSLGIAIDYTSLVRERSNIQAYADAATLAAAVSGKNTEAELTEIAAASLQSQTSSNPDLELNLLGRTNQTIQLRLNSNYKPAILGIFGYNNFDVSAVAEAPISQNRKLNLALALDTTLSMSGTRIETLKEAGVDLLDIIETVSSNPDDVKVSIIPFADYVRIDPSNRGQSWLTVQDDVDRSFQVVDRDLSTNCQDIIENERRRVECDVRVEKTINDTLTWAGCMASREDGYHETVGFRGRKLPGHIQSSSCGSHFNIMRPLSSDIGSAKTAITNLKTAGRTYMPVGLMWAWRSLDRDLPFKEAISTRRKDTRDVILLMSDGSNTTSLNGTITDFEGILHAGVTDDDEESGRIADELTADMCRDIKAEKIEIITVAFEITETDTITLLRNCASSPSDFYNARSSNDLLTAFQNIGANLGAIRLSR